VDRLELGLFRLYMTDNGRLPCPKPQLQPQCATTMAKQNEYLKIWKHIKWRNEK